MRHLKPHFKSSILGTHPGSPERLAQVSHVILVGGAQHAALLAPTGGGEEVEEERLGVRKVEGGEWEGEEEEEEEDLRICMEAMAPASTVGGREVVKMNPAP